MRSETDGRYDLDRRSMRTTAVIELRKVGPEECVAKRPTVEARVELREPGSVALPGGRHERRGHRFERAGGKGSKGGVDCRAKTGQRCAKHLTIPAT